MGCSTRIGPPPGSAREVGPDGTRDADARGDGCRHQNADGGVHAARDEGARRDGTAVARRREQEDLRHRLGGDVTEAHQRSRGEPDALDGACEIRALLEVVGRLVPGDAEFVAAEEDHRHPVVDQRDAVPVDLIDDVAGREQRAVARGEFEFDGSRRAGDAVDGGVSGVVGDDRPESERPRWRRHRC